MLIYDLIRMEPSTNPPSVGTHAADSGRFRYSVLACSPVGLWSLHAQPWDRIFKVKLCSGVTGPYGPGQASF